MTEVRALFSRPGPAIALILVALLLDQAIKIAVEAYLPFQEPVHVVPMLALYRTWNTGVAFSMLAGMDGWFIVGMRLGIVALVLWLWKGSPADRHFTHLGYALIIAGALGNLVDRFLYGHVVDYVLFYTDTWSFAVFNLADSFITMGAVAVVLDEFLTSRRKTQRD